MKMFIDGSCDIVILGLNLRIQDKESSYHMELKNQDLENKVERND